MYDAVCLLLTQKSGGQEYWASISVAIPPTEQGLINPYMLKELEELELYPAFLDDSFWQGRLDRNKGSSKINILEERHQDWSLRPRFSPRIP